MPTATIAMTVVTRNGLETRLVPGDSRFDDFEIVPGDKIRFLGIDDLPKRYARVQSKKLGNGRYLLTPGMTLTQLIKKIAGGRSANVTKAAVKRVSEKGRLETSKYKLSSIRRGKTEDPELIDGDIVELR